MHPILQKLSGKIIVSVQAEAGEPFYEPMALLAMAKSVVQGGASGLRLAGADSIVSVKSEFPEIPIIGITKPPILPDNYKSVVYITPNYGDVVELHDAGADIVALDATLRDRPGDETLASIIERARSRFPQLLLMADISTLEEGQKAEDLGFDLIATTLSGYTDGTASKANEGPDFQLLEELMESVHIPVILEGRLWVPGQVKQAFDIGAHAVVIGSAITRPHQITRRFCDIL